VLFAVSVVHVPVTYITCRLLQEARTEAARINEDSRGMLVEINKAQAEVRAARDAMLAAQSDAEGRARALAEELDNLKLLALKRVEELKQVEQARAQKGALMEQLKGKSKEEPGGDQPVEKAELEDLLREVLDLPPLLKLEEQPPLANLPGCTAKMIRPFRDDGTTNEFRELVRTALNELKQKDRLLVHKFVAPPDNQVRTNQFKNELIQIQMKVGLLMFKLDTALEELRSRADQRANETRRWQAMYDYVCAQLELQIGLAYEYNAALGKMRKEFPERDPMLHGGWELVLTENMADRDAEKYFRRGRATLEKMTQDYAKTPWAVLAERELARKLGLQWQPFEK